MNSLAPAARQYPVLATTDHVSQNIEIARKTYDTMLGEYGRFSRDLMIRKQQ
jgi:hypothetical protein